MEVRRTPLSGPSAWVGPEIQNDTDWIVHLDDAAIADIDAALRGVQAEGLSIPFEKEDFQLPSMAGLLDSIPDQLENGRCMVLVRGVPRDRYTVEECEMIYWGIALPRSCGNQAHHAAPVQYHRTGGLSCRCPSSSGNP